MNIVLLGVQGSGKSTLSNCLNKEFGYFVLIPGSLYRAEAKAKTDFGLKAMEYWGKGNLCPDEMTNELVSNTIKSTNNTNIVFDGYPRTSNQAMYLDSITTVDLVFDLYIPDEAAIQRLLKRREIENRPDDTEEIIKQRIAVYHTNNDDIIMYYKKSNRYKLLNAELPKEDVFLIAKNIILGKQRGEEWKQLKFI